MIGIRWRLVWAALPLLAVALGARAHPLVEDAMDVTIGRDRVVVELRVTPEEIAVAEGVPTRRDITPEQRRAHGLYVQKHLRVEVDGEALTAAVVEPGAGSAAGALVPYRLEYAVARPPGVVRVGQTLLADREPWTVSCVVRFRQEDQAAYQTGLLTPGQVAEFGCDWTAPATSQPTTRPVTEVRAWPTFRAYMAHGVMHILTGYDHLLFVSALVLAATSLWDLVKVVTAFTVAHTLTLTLSVLNVVRLSERIVEPMIAASIVFVAVQNAFWPQQSRGWARLGVAFAFGLFHGLGFAGGLQEAMADMPRVALGVALLAFSLGVELGHQTVVLPLYGALRVARGRRGAMSLYPLGMRVCSVGIAVGGGYFLVEALRQ